jgi:hypothetical protein
VSCRRSESTEKKDSLAVGKVSERALLVDDADGGLLRADAHTLDIVRRPAERPEPLVHDVRGLDGGLRVELGGVRDLEEHVLHHVRGERALERKGLALEEHVVEAPRLGRQHRGQARLAALDEVRQVDGARARVARCPGLARARVGRVAVCPERLAVYPCLRDGVDRLVAR